MSGKIFFPKNASRRHKQFASCKQHDFYLMGAFLDGVLLAYKIGISENCKKRRLSLQRGSFARIVILNCYQCSCKGIAVYLEKIVLKDLKVFRLRGEWFRPLSQIIDAFEKIEQIYHYMHDGDVHRCG